METLSLQTAAEQLLVQEAWLLDQERYEEWLDLYTDTATYWVPLEVGQADPDETCSLIYDDRMLMEARVHRLRLPSNHSQQPGSRSSRSVANIVVERTGAADGSVCVRSKLVMVEFFRRGRQRVFAGTCYHTLVRAAGELKISSKRVDLINSDDAMEGITVPF